jgi:glutaredoxin
MSFPAPDAVGYTVLTKRECLYCDKVKSLFESKDISYKAVACDDFLVGPDREQFLDYVKRITLLTTVRFPLVFHNACFVGGYVDTRDYIESESW